MTNSAQSHPSASQPTDMVGVEFGTSADGFAVACIDDTAYAMLPGRDGTHNLAAAWLERRAAEAKRARPSLPPPPPPPARGLTRPKGALPAARCEAVGRLPHPMPPLQHEEAAMPSRGPARRAREQRWDATAPLAWGATPVAPVDATQRRNYRLGGRPSGMRTKVATTSGTRIPTP